MLQFRNHWLTCSCVALSGVAFSGPLWAQDEPISASTAVGEVAFDYPGAAEPTVQVNLTEAMFHDLVGIGEAAVAGVVEVVAETLADQQGAGRNINLTAEQLDAVQRIFTTVKGVVRGAQVRIYEDQAERAAGRPSVSEHYSQKLQSTGWDEVVRISDDDDQVRVMMIRESGAIRGVFVCVDDGDDQVLVNVACDLSPQNVKELTSTALRIAKDLGGEDAIQEVLGKVADKLD